MAFLGVPMEIVVAIELEPSFFEYGYGFSLGHAWKSLVVDVL